MTTLSERIVANAQKRNLMGMLEQLRQNNLDDALVRPLYYPQSSILLKVILQKMGDEICHEERFVGISSDFESQVTKHLAMLRSDSETVLCFFPDFTAQIEHVTSDLPVLEVLASSIDQLYEYAKSKGLHFFFCASTDLRTGVVIDIYEADPAVHRTAGAVFDLYFWNT